MSRKDQIFDDEEGEPSSSTAVIIENDVQKLSLVDNIDPEEDENLGLPDESIYRTTKKVVKDDSVPVEKGNLCRSLCCWILFLIAFGVPSWKVTSYFREINSIQVKKASTTQKEGHLTHGPRYSRYPLNGANVEQIVLLGERNSGTNWVTSMLGSCFPTVPVRTYLTSWKHWFQVDDESIDHIKTFVVLSTINPYDWVEGMRRVPRDFPNHMNMDWKDFVTTPWTMKRSAGDFLYSNTTDRICQYHFKFDEVVPCKLNQRIMLKRARWDARRHKHRMEGYITHYKSIYNTTQFEPPHNQTGQSTPCYELRRDGSGQPYDSVVDMRSDKIRNHLSVAEWSWVNGFELLRFDDISSDSSYLSTFLDKVEKHVGVNASCKNLPNPPWKTKQNEVSREYMDWMTNRVDWEAEALLGYHPVMS